MVTTLVEIAGALLIGSVVRDAAGNTAGVVTLLVLAVYPVLVCYGNLNLSETGSFFLLSLLIWLSLQFRAHWPEVQKQRKIAVCGLMALALGPSLLTNSASARTPCSLHFPFVLLLSLLSFWWFLISLKEDNPIGLLMTGIPLTFLLYQILRARPAFPVYPLLIANGVTLLSIAWRGWTNKRMPGTL